MIAALVLGGACGDPLRSASSPGRPLFQLDGSIVLPSEQVAPEDPRVALLWVDPFQRSERDVPSSPQAVAMDMGEGGFTLTLYEPPPSETAVDLVGSPGETPARLSLGEVVLFDDVKADGTFEVTARADGSLIVDPDVYRGGGLAFFAVYVWSWSDSPTLVKRFGNVISAKTGYVQGGVDCSSADTAVINNVFPRSAMIINVTDPSHERPFQRTCLRSMFIPGSPGGP